MMKMNATQAENLRILIRHMETNVTRRLNMRSLANNEFKDGHWCRTPACAWGEAHMLPHFQAHFGTLENRKPGLLPADVFGPTGLFNFSLRGKYDVSPQEWDDRPNPPRRRARPAPGDFPTSRCIASSRARPIGACATTATRGRSGSRTSRRSSWRVGGNLPRGAPRPARDGTAWVNLGDSYAGESRLSSTSEEARRTGSGGSRRQQAAEQVMPRPSGSR
jgi:hypothetical protein